MALPILLTLEEPEATELSETALPFRFLMLPSDPMSDVDGLRISAFRFDELKVDILLLLFEDSELRSACKAACVVVAGDIVCKEADDQRDGVRLSSDKLIVVTFSPHSKAVVEMDNCEVPPPPELKLLLLAADTDPCLELAAELPVELAAEVVAEVDVDVTADEETDPGRTPTDPRLALLLILSPLPNRLLFDVCAA